jgi:hypothetical protein
MKPAIHPEQVASSLSPLILTSPGSADLRSTKHNPGPKVLPSWGYPGVFVGYYQGYVGFKTLK